jgi:ribulose-phosphate 3-epimerase
MSVIAPTILCETEDDYKATVERLSPFAKRVHIDLTDGEFAPTFTVGVNQIWWPAEWQVDIHAMVAHPSQYVDALIQMKPATVIFHAEVSEDLLPTLQKLKAAGIRAGVGLLKPTVPSTVSELIEMADHVLVFSGNLGHYGGTASLMQLEKVRLIRTIHPEVEVGWDGGANLENAFSLTQGGVDVINCGGAINKATDPAAAYQQLVDEINKHSVI